MEAESTNPGGLYLEGGGKNSEFLSEEMVCTELLFFSIHVFLKTGFNSLIFLLDYKTISIFPFNFLCPCGGAFVFRTTDSGFAPTDGPMRIFGFSTPPVKQSV